LDQGALSKDYDLRANRVNKHESAKLDAVVQGLGLAWVGLVFWRVVNRFRLLGRAVRYGFVAGEVYSELDFRDGDVVFAALALSYDPQPFQYEVLYARFGRDVGFFRRMEEALIGIGYTVEPSRLVLFRCLKPPPELSPEAVARFERRERLRGRVDRKVRREVVDDCEEDVCR
jgi:hypothetical protein